MLSKVASHAYPSFGRGDGPPGRFPRRAVVMMVMPTWYRVTELEPFGATMDRDADVPHCHSWGRLVILLRTTVS